MSGTVLDHITEQLAGGREFHKLFYENITSIYEFDATEIQDFLQKHDTESDDKRRVNIIATRQLLSDKLCDLFTSLQNRELYNRRKMETIASDVYILGD